MKNIIVNSRCAIATHAIVPRFSLSESFRRNVYPVAWSFHGCSSRCPSVNKRINWVLGATRRSIGPQSDSNEDFSEEIITFFTADGIVQLPGHLQNPQVRTFRPARAPLPTWQEQGICIGSVFQVQATNGDPTRRLNVLGFCRCIDMLSEVVEDVVLSRGGEVFARECDNGGGLAERLKMTVAIPFLFGVPPEYEALSAAIADGGGIVDKVQLSWQFGGPQLGGAVWGRPPAAQGFRRAL